MAQEPQFSHVTSKGNNVEDPDPAWLASVTGSDQWCRTCRSLKPSVAAIDVCLATEPDNVHMTSVWPPGVMVISSELLEIIARHGGQANLHVGAVYGPDGKGRESFSSIRGRHRVVIRGGAESSMNTCSACGTVAYSPAPPEQVVSGTLSCLDIAETQVGLLVPADIARSIKRQGLKGLYVRKLKIVEVPQDGFEIADAVSVQGESP